MWVIVLVRLTEQYDLIVLIKLLELGFCFGTCLYRPSISMMKFVELIKEMLVVVCCEMLKHSSSSSSCHCFLAGC